MRPSDKNLSETDIRPARGKASVVRADSADSRNWLAQAPVCPLLAHYQIQHAAVAHMPSPFRIVRSQLGGSYFMACFGGEGRVLVDGRWFRCTPGKAVLLPPGTLHTFHTPPGKVWDFCWVRYQERTGQRPLATAESPVVGNYDAEPLRHAILGLHRECSVDTSPTAAEHWVRLVHHYVLRFAQPAEVDHRLSRLWERVAESLEHPWTIGEMARDTHLSDKQLQRLCRQQLGRTPRQQLIWLRMRRAADLLAERGDKIETIAMRVGYQNAFVFSTTFKRVMGWSPSRYPVRGATEKR
jgi:AraC-like DNA-binding protein